MFSKLAATMTMLAATGLSARAQNPYLNQVTDYVNTSPATRNLLAMDFRSFSVNTGYLLANSNTYHEATYDLRAGYVYAFVARCDEDCTDVNLTLYGPNGEKIAEHTSADNSPSIWHFVTRAGRHTIRATIPGCSAPVGCYLAVKSMYK